MRFLTFTFFLGMAACARTPVFAPVDAGDPLPARTAIRNLVAVVEAVEPVAEALCVQRAPTLNCDFLIVVDETRGAPANAFQTQDDTGRPVIAFTVPLIAEARNRDELAFIMSHEVAHHIMGHITRQNQSALAGAQILGGLAYVLSGGSEESIRRGAEIGAEIGARTYSKNFELEADAMGAVIAKQAGYDPLKGAEFFLRIPDPGHKFLGSHPANGDRLATVQRAVSRM
ncbi:M48 family metalloprotease [Yoonia sp. MH D7]